MNRLPTALPIVSLSLCRGARNSEHKPSELVTTVLVMEWLS
jgi:hypothetical protein